MFTDTELRDPTPPVPGAGERAAVATRAKQLKRNRRVAAAGGALGVVAVLSFGVVALAGGGSSNPSTTEVQVAGTSVTRDAAPSTTVAPAPEVATVPSPAPAVEAPSVQNTPAPAMVPATFTISGVVSGVPAGVSATVRLAGDGGTFATTTAADGSFSLSGVPAGHYSADYSWTSPDGAAQVGRVVGGVDVNGDLTISFS